MAWRQLASALKSVAPVSYCVVQLSLHVVVVQLARQLPKLMQSWLAEHAESVGQQFCASQFEQAVPVELQVVAPLLLPDPPPLLLPEPPPLPLVVEHALEQLLCRQELKAGPAFWQADDRVQLLALAPLGHTQFRSLLVHALSTADSSLEQLFCRQLRQLEPEIPWPGQFELEYDEPELLLPQAKAIDASVTAARDTQRFVICSSV